MPHCVVEYSDNIEQQVTPKQLIDTVFDGAVEAGLFERDSIKVRAVSYSSYRVGDVKQGFVHVNASILSGRTEQQKYQLSQSILDAVKNLNLSGVSITVDVIDMLRSVYAKAVIE